VDALLMRYFELLHDSVKIDECRRVVVPRNEGKGDYKNAIEKVYGFVRRVTLIYAKEINDERQNCIYGNKQKYNVSKRKHIITLSG